MAEAKDSHPSSERLLGADPMHIEGSPPITWLTVLAQCPSSNDWARDHHGLLGHGDVVWAHRQTAGRGQRGRSWVAPEGAITFSMVADLRAGDLPLIGLLSGLAIAYTVDDILETQQQRDRCAIKWPNDIYLRNRKLAGILCENTWQQSASFAPSHQRVIIGMGINYRSTFADHDLQHFDQHAVKPISLHEVVNCDAPMENLISGIRRYLLEGIGLLNVGRWQQVLPELRKRDWLLGRSITIDEGGRLRCGQAAGIADDGQLVIAGSNGGLSTVAAGHIRETTTTTPLKNPGDPVYGNG